MSWHGQARKGDNVYIVINEISTNITAFTSKKKANDYVKFIINDVTCVMHKCSKTGLISATIPSYDGKTKLSIRNKHLVVK